MVRSLTAGAGATRGGVQGHGGSQPRLGAPTALRLRAEGSGGAPARPGAREVTAGFPVLSSSRLSRSRLRTRASARARAVCARARRHEPEPRVRVCTDGAVQSGSPSPPQPTTGAADEPLRAPSSASAPATPHTAPGSGSFRLQGRCGGRPAGVLLPRPPPFLSATAPSVGRVPPSVTSQRGLTASPPGASESAPSAFSRSCYHHGTHCRCHLSIMFVVGLPACSLHSRRTGGQGFLSGPHHAPPQGPRLRTGPWAYVSAEITDTSSVGPSPSATVALWSVVVGGGATSAGAQDPPSPRPPRVSSQCSQAGQGWGTDPGEEAAVTPLRPGSRPGTPGRGHLSSVPRFPSVAGRGGGLDGDRAQTPRWPGRAWPRPPFPLMSPEVRTLLLI